MGIGIAILILIIQTDEISSEADDRPSFPESMLSLGIVGSIFLIFAGFMIVIELYRSATFAKEKLGSTYFEFSGIASACFAINVGYFGLIQEATDQTISPYMKLMVLQIITILAIALLLPVLRFIEDYQWLRSRQGISIGRQSDSSQYSGEYQTFTSVQEV